MARSFPSHLFSNILPQGVRGLVFIRIEFPLVTLVDEGVGGVARVDGIDVGGRIRTDDDGSGHEGADTFNQTLARRLIGFTHNCHLLSFNEDFPSTHDIGSTLDGCAWESASVEGVPRV